jgi:hypothetical protein
MADKDLDALFYDTVRDKSRTDELLSRIAETEANAKAGALKA